MGEQANTFEPQRMSNHELDTTADFDNSRLKRKLEKINGKYRSQRYRLKKKWRQDKVTMLSADVVSKRQEALFDNRIGQLNEKAAFLCSFKKGLFALSLRLTAECGDKIANRKVSSEVDYARQGHGHRDKTCVMEEYVRRMTLGFPMQEVLGCFEARIEAAVTQNEIGHAVSRG
jgi:hypothetical protein